MFEEVIKIGIPISYSKIKQFIEGEQGNQCELVMTKDEFEGQKIIQGNSNSKVKLNIRCKCGEVFKTSFAYFKSDNKRFCNKCGTKTKLKKATFTHETIKNFIEQESESGCKLITSKEEYIDTSHKITIQCKCGSEFVTPFVEFKHDGKRQCNKCGEVIRTSAKKHEFLYVKDYVEKELEGKYKLLSKSYKNCMTPLRFQCEFGHIFTKRFNDLRKGSECPECSARIKSENSRTPYEEVKGYIESYGYKLLSEDYINHKEKIMMKCPDGHIFEMSFGNFKSLNNRCPHCFAIRRHNELLELKTHLRGKIQQWRKDSMEDCNYKCVITKGSFNDVHHLYGFQSIVEESLEKTKMPIYQTIGEYTNEELKTIEEKCIELHYEYGLGVCLNRDVHMKFHNVYGQKNTTPEQFDEFQQDCLDGKYMFIN